ncbi:MAG: hypothetical protein ACOZHQ_13675 [Thermodesulfobacteriota bacterium]
MKGIWKALFAAAVLALVPCGLTACVSMLEPYDPKSVSRETREVRPEVLWASLAPDGRSMAIQYHSAKMSGIFLMDIFPSSWPAPGPEQAKPPAMVGLVTAWLRKDRPRCGHGSPVFSPDGKRIAYVSACGEPHGDIHIMDRDGSNDRRLTDTPDYDRGPSFTLDGNQIFFVRGQIHSSRSRVVRPGVRDWDIYWADLTTGAVNALTNKHYYKAGEPQMLPDGKHLLAYLYPIHTDSKHCLWSISLENPDDEQPITPKLVGLDPREGENVDYCNLYYPILSKDGTQLVFSRIGRSLYFTDMRTMETRIETPLDIGMLPLAMSPDFNQVFFTTEVEPRRDPKYPPCFSNLWLYRRDTGEVRRFFIDFSRVAPKPEPAAIPAAGNSSGQQ